VNEGSLICERVSMKSVTVGDGAATVVGEVD
jgi:hypothetical protein